MARYRQSVHVVATAAAQPATDSWRSGSTTRTMIQPTNTIGNGNLPRKSGGAEDIIHDRHTRGGELDALWRVIFRRVSIML